MLPLIEPRGSSHYVYRIWQKRPGPFDFNVVDVNARSSDVVAVARVEVEAVVAIEAARENISGNQFY